jgi:hypothetical protein
MQHMFNHICGGHWLPFDIDLGFITRSIEHGDLVGGIKYDREEFIFFGTRHCLVLQLHVVLVQERQEHGLFFIFRFFFFSPLFFFCSLGLFGAPWETCARGGPPPSGNATVTVTHAELSTETWLSAFHQTVLSDFPRYWNICDQRRFSFIL